MGFWRLIDEKAATRLVYSSPVFTSVITVQAHQRVNVGIVVGSVVSDILSAYTGAAISGVLSTASCSLTLQRQTRENMGTDFWHDVDDWSILKADGEAASKQEISVTPEPETCNYRIGTKAGAWESGALIVRIGTT